MMLQGLAKMLQLKSSLKVVRPPIFNFTLRVGKARGLCVIAWRGLYIGIVQEN